MSGRVPEWDGWESDGPPNASELFERRAISAIYSRNGRKHLRELREALLALPRHELIAGAMCRKPGTRDDGDEEEDVEYRHTLPADWLTREPEPWPEPVEWAGAQMAFWASIEPGRIAYQPEQYQVCAVGAYVWWKKVQAGKEPVAAFAELPALDAGEDEDDYDGSAIFDTAREGKRAGLTYTLAWELASANDEVWNGDKVTPAERWQKFMDWIDGVLAAPPLPRGTAPREFRRLGYSYTW